jgi:hypothetical protein
MHSKHLQIRLLKPAFRRYEYDTLDTDGIESQELVAYNIIHDEKRNVWIGGRATGVGPTIEAGTLAEVMVQIGNLIE